MSVHIWDISTSVAPLDTITLTFGGGGSYTNEYTSGTYDITDTASVTINGLVEFTREAFDFSSPYGGGWELSSDDKFYVFRFELPRPQTAGVLAPPRIPNVFTHLANTGTVEETGSGSNTTELFYQVTDEADYVLVGSYSRNTTYDPPDIGPDTFNYDVYASYELRLIRTGDTAKFRLSWNLYYHDGIGFGDLSGLFLPWTLPATWPDVTAADDVNISTLAGLDALGGTLTVSESNPGGTFTAWSSNFTAEVGVA